MSSPARDSLYSSLSGSFNERFRIIVTAPGGKCCPAFRLVVDEGGSFSIPSGFGHWGCQCTVEVYYEETISEDRSGGGGYSPGGGFGRNISPPTMPLIPALPSIPPVLPAGVSGASGGDGYTRGGGFGQSSNQVNNLNTRENLINSVQNNKLTNAVNEIYRPGATVGDGGLADAVRHELSTGELVGGRSHLTKATERIINLENIIRTQNLSPNDLRIAQELLDDLRRATGGN